MKVRAVIKEMEEDGWRLVRTRGDHRNFRKETNLNVATIVRHDRDDVTPGVLSDIRKKTGLTLR